MSDLLVFSSDGADVRWVDADGVVCEHATLSWDNEAWTIVVRLTQHRVEAVYRLSPLWQLRQFMLFRDLDEPDLWLGTDGHGRWGEVNGAHRPDLDGAHDIAIGGALFPLTTSIRNLPLRPGQAGHVRMLEVDVETLAVVPSLHTFVRVDERRWAVEAEGGHRNEFDVDDHGVVVDTPTHRRQR